MHKSFLLALSMMCLSVAQDATADASSADNFGHPISTELSVPFADSSASFHPNADTAAMLADAKDASVVYISGRTSTAKPSAGDEALALRRALSARSYLVARGVSPLKIMVGFASAADFVADNSTPAGRYQNQRVDIEIVYARRRSEGADK